MNRFLIMLAAVAVLLAPVADARDGRQDPRAQPQGQAAKKRLGPVQRSERPGRAERDRRGHGRLTQEERRQLRRDLDRANREIYRR